MQEAARIFEWKVDVAEGEDDQGHKVPVLILHHGQHRILAYQKGELIHLDYPIELTPHHTKALAEKDKKIQNDFYRILHRELQDGRSGYFFNIEFKDKIPHLNKIIIQQRLVVQKLEPYTLQRIGDAVQELVIIGMRCGSFLGHTFQEPSLGRKASSSSADVMYR